MIRETHWQKIRARLARDLLENGKKARDWQRVDKGLQESCKKLARN